MKINYQQATNDDINHIYNLNVELFKKYDDNKDNELLLEILLQDIKDNIKDYISIFNNNLIVGYYCLESELNTTYLIDLYIFDDYKNQGIGTIVMNDILLENKKPIYLYTYIENEDAINFYNKFNFVTSTKIDKDKIKMELL